MKSRKWVISALISTIMALVGAITTTHITKVQASDSNLMSIVSIDAGRKFFSRDQIKKIIDKAYAKGYTDIELILGNDGLRFLLDDMSVTVNGKTYPSDIVKEAMKKGTQDYYNDPNGTYLTQSDMDDIVSYAREKHVGIIPVINSPGHMDAILTAMRNLGITNPQFKTSVRTVDLNNQSAIDFTQKLVGKYVKYFSQYSTIFNFGFDEYANDVKPGGGWKAIQETGEYKKFVIYANQMAALAKQYNMKPMAFNDGIYYNNDDRDGTFDPNIIISLWTSGWDGYNPAPAGFLINKGFKIINTNDSWYWVLGRMNSTDGWYHYQMATDGIKKKGFLETVGSGPSVPIIGSMQAIWSDVPSNAYEDQDLFMLMDLFSSRNSQYMLYPANYKSVDQALAQVPRENQWNIYTENSLATLKQAMDSVQRGLRSNQQNQVDEYAHNILQAIKDLKIRRANYQKVDAAIQEANSLHPSEYENFSVVENAVHAVKFNLNITQQEEVDGMANSILTAISELKKIDDRHSKESVPNDSSNNNSNHSKIVNSNDKVADMKHRGLPTTGEHKGTLYTIIGSAILTTLVISGFICSAKRKNSN